MYRTAQWLTLGIVLGVAVPVEAQPAFPFPQQDAEQDLPKERDRARARFQASQAQPHAIARAMNEAATVQLTARFRSFLAGITTLPFLLETAQSWLEAQQALSDRPADRLAAVALYWMLTREFEDINQTRYDAGKIVIQDLAEARYDRLGAEIRWHQARPDSDKAPGFAASSEVRRLWDDHQFRAPTSEVKRMARARFAAAGSDPETLVREQVRAAQAFTTADIQVFFGGRGTLEFLMDSSRRLLDAQCAAHPEPADQVAAFADHWLRLSVIEIINQQRYETGKISAKDLWSTRERRLLAERWLIDARAKAGPRAAAGPASDLRLVPNTINAQTIARRKFATVSADPHELARGRVEMARRVTEGRFKEFIAGRGTLDFVLEASRRQLDADLALSDDPAEARAARERHWSFLWQVLQVNRRRFAKGRIGLADYAQSQVALFQAELRLAQAREGAKP